MSTRDLSLPAAPGGGATGRVRALAGRIAPHHVALAAIVALSALLNASELAQNGWANEYYSAAVKSMLTSWHNFFYVSFDAGGLVSVDKPPLALWLQAASAKAFGFSSLSLLLPEAICGVLSVIALYVIVAKRFGAWAGIAAAAALAVFPSLVAVSRDNNPDALLVLLMVLAAGAALTAIENGRLRSLLWCAVLVGLAFNTKMLAAYLVVPGIALAYLVCAPGGVWLRLRNLVAAGVAMAAVSLAWLAAVDLTPAASRPWVGSSSTNSALDLALNYNGVGRVGGQFGGPGQIGGGGARPSAGGAGGFVPPGAAAGGSFTPPAGAFPGGPPPGVGAAGGMPPGLGAAGGPPPGMGGAAGGGFRPGAGGGPGGGGGPGSAVFGGPTGALRLFGSSLGSQGGWLLALAAAGIAAIGLTLTRRRRDPKLAALVVFGGWFLAEAVILSFSKGIVHPYYVSALGPPAAALVGAGAAAMAVLARRGGWRVAVPIAGFAAAAAVQVILLQREDFLTWFVPVLVGGVAVAALTMALRRRLAGWAVAAALGLLLVAPAAYSATVWDHPGSGTFPAAGTTQAGGPFSGSAATGTTTALGRYLKAHRTAGTTWDVLAQSSMSASPLILEGVTAGSMGGFNGDDPALTADGAAKLIAAGKVRYFLVGGSFPGRTGNGASAAVANACTGVSSSAYGGTSGAAGGRPGGGGPGGAQTLYDCQGKAAAVADAG